PDTRFLTHFNLASIVTYHTKGRIPVFIDPRTETAYPPEVMQAYLAFHRATSGWQDMLNTYHITGVVLAQPQESPQFSKLRSAAEAQNAGLIARFEQLPGWQKAFTGPYAVIFLRSTN
ncbi:MAG: hypothetical protein K2Q01_07210, partial [Rickettsiales bacterium]|nr:hypothetical protein [Rickettsiales bacterium]